MRKVISFVLVSLLCLTLSSCFLTSMEPFYERGKTVYDPALLGTWHMTNCSENSDVKEKYCVMTLTATEQTKDGKTDKGYSIAFRDDRGMTSELDGFLFELAGTRFLDTAVDEGPQLDVATAVHLVPGHVLWKVSTDGTTLELVPLRRSLAREAATAGLATFDSGGDTVVSAPTADVQKWLAKHAMDPQSYEKPLEWKKGPAPTAKRK